MTKSDNMRHMEFIQAITDSDADILRYKETTYQGSWKAAGGRSAWFMARRNLDRLITMMAPKDFPSHVKTWENIRDTTGALRNFVHYGHAIKLDLPGSIEATMMILEHLLDSYQSEDIFMKIRAAPKGEDGTVLACLRDARRYFTLVEAEMVAEGVVVPEEVPSGATVMYRTPTTDVYQLIADEKGLTREEVKERVYQLFYGKPAQPPLTTEMPVLEKVYLQNGGDNAPDITPGLIPWMIGEGYYDALRIRVGKSLTDEFYHMRAPGCWYLIAVVEAQACPREIAELYVFDFNRWTLKRSKVPAELDDTYPRVPREMNQYEYETSSDTFRFMYDFHAEPQKWILREQYADWSKEAAL